MQTRIHKNTFKGCAQLQRISLPPGLKEIEDGAFQGCTSLQSVSMGSAVKNIGVSAFCGDSALTSVDRLNGLVSEDSSKTFDTVGNYAFAGTGIRTANLALRSSAIQTFWGDGCFQDCKSLEYVHFLSANYMSRSMFKDCTALTGVDWDVALMAYTYPGIFDGCGKLKKVNFPAELLFVPENAFKGCAALSSMQFTSYGEKSAIDDVQKNAFCGCAGLTELELPSSVDSLDELDQACLSGMPNLQTVKFHGLVLDQLQEDGQPVSAVSRTGFFGLRHDVGVWCKDMPSGQRWEYVYDESQYDPPAVPEYSSDREKTSDFQPGRWYYNARDVYAEARALGKPCLFIFSLWGCGPCAVYQKNLWNSAEFHEWFGRQKFLLCGLECEQQPAYDEHLRFLVDIVSVNAENFAKEDEGESLADKQANVFGQKFRRYAVGDSFASTLMTPVLVFMDEDGKCWDYTYHNIARDIKTFGVDGMIQRLKSLCLYHFDGNRLEDAKWTVDAGKAFDPADYASDADNPWLVGKDVMNMSIDAADYDYSAMMTVSQLEKYMYDRLMEVGQYASAVSDGKVYLGGCLMSDFAWIWCMFQDSGVDIESVASADTLTSLFSPWYFKIGAAYYKMKFDKNSKVRIDNPCGSYPPKEDIFRVSFEQTTYP